MKGFRGNLISASPFVLYTGDGVDLTEIQKLISHQDAVFLISIWWTAEPLQRVFTVVKNHYQRKVKFKRHCFIYLCNSYKEERFLRSFGLDARFCHQNATLDENIFTILNHKEKIYDAIYDAQLAEFKRHYLCSEINKLALISYVEQKNSLSDYPLETRNMLSDAAWINDPVKERGTAPSLSPSEVSEAYNQARVGLCLSKVEGAMFASVQYLLCGLPVINVSNIGGRDYFLTNYVSLKVEDTPKAIENGVGFLMGTNFDPYEIRSETLKLMWEQRNSLECIINESLVKLGSDFLFKWNLHSKNKMLDYISLDGLSKKLI